MNSQHRMTGLVRLEHQRAEDRRLTSAFVSLRKHLAKDPHPSLWRNRRRKSNALRVPGLDAVRVTELVLRSAIATRDVRIIEATATECDHFWDTLRAQGMQPYYRFANGALSMQIEGLAAHRELTETAQSIAELLSSRSSACADATRVRLSRALRSLKRLWFATSESELPAPSRKHAIP